MRQRHRAPSGEGLRSPGKKVSSESLCAPGDQPEKRESGRERHREREREKARHGDQSSDGAKVFYSTLCEYLYSLTRQLFSAEIKIKTYKLSRKHEVIHMKERGL